MNVKITWGNFNLALKKPPSLLKNKYIRINLLVSTYYKVSGGPIIIISHYSKLINRAYIITFIITYFVNIVVIY
jgi:hypothetical protein